MSRTEISLPTPDGDARAYTISAGQPTVQLYGSSDD